MILKQLLGKILTDMGFVTTKQLEQAIQRQRKIYEEKALPERLQRGKLVSEARMTAFADTTPLLGQILTDMGIITEEQLKEALEEQDKPAEIYKSLDTEKLGTAIETGYIVNSTLNLAGVLTLIMRYVNRVTNSVASTLMLVDDNTGELIFSVPTGPKADQLTDIRLPSGKGIAGWVAKHEQHVLVPDVKKDSRFYPEIDRRSGFETKSILCVPLKAKAKLIGVLEAINKVDGGAFTEEDAILLSIFAYQAAVAIENARLYDELKDQMGELLQSASERRKVEEELRKSERRFRDLFENSPDAIFVEDLNGKVLDVNPAACRLHGRSREELIDEDVYRLIPPDKRREAASDFSKLASGKYDHIEGYSLTKDVRSIPVEIRARRIEYSGKPALLLMVRDITERKKAEKELLRASKLESVGILAGGIAHDFNNFLTAILGNISLSMTHVDPDDKIYKRLAEVEKASLRARDLTQQLLTFSKGGAPIKKPTSIKGLLKESINFALSGSNVSCELSIPDDIWTVEIDEGQMSQVINNIIINADNAMPEGGVIKISIENATVESKDILPLKEGKYVKLTIRDTGIGIPEEHLQKIFDPYFSTKSRGFGLGLATAYSIVKNHDGLITVESELGVGTTFFIYIPASGVKALEKEDKGEKAYTGTGKILVMDDEELVREVAGDILRNFGFEVEFAKDGTEAIELYKRAMDSGDRFDAVIIDLTVPGGMGGREAIKELIQIDPEVKTIVSSGYSNDPIMANYKEHGFSGVIAKPYRIEELGDVLKKIFED